MSNATVLPVAFRTATLFAAALAVGSVLPVSAADQTATWIGTTGNWTDASRWSSAPFFPDNGNGGNTFDAVINSGTVTLSSMVEIESLALNGGTLDLADGGRMTVALPGGVLTNAGTIRLSKNSSRLTLPAGASLIGGGDIFLSNTNATLALPSGTLVNTGNTIRGFGNLQSMIENQNVIRAEGGALTLLGDVNNTTGTIELAASGTLLLNGSISITGGLLQGVAGGHLNANTSTTNVLEDVTFAGVFAYGGASDNSSTISLRGTLTNNGAVTFLDNGSNNGAGPDQHFIVPASETATLNGTGQIVLNQETGFIGTNASSTLNHGTGHTLSGNGTINSLVLNNTGTLAPAGGVMTVSNTMVNGAGTIDLAANGELDLNAGSVTGGQTITGVAGAHLNASVSSTNLLEDVTLAGVFTYGGLSDNSSTIGLRGTITNNGVVTLLDNGSNNGTGSDQRFNVPAGESVTLNGIGQVALSQDTGFTGGSPASTLSHGTDHTLSGNGTFNSLVLNSTGTLAPAGGVMTVSNTTVNGAGMISLAADGELNLIAGGITGGQTITGVAGAHLNASASSTNLLEDVTFAGVFTYGGPSDNSSTIGLRGTITNNGVVTFTDGGGNNGAGPDQRFTVPASETATLDGSGQIVLNQDTGFIGTNASSTLNHGSDHTITGNGTFAVRIANQGIVRADGGTLFLTGGFTQSGGRLEAAAGATVDLGSTAALFSGGSMGGAGTIVGSIDNQGGTADPGFSPGTLTVDGEYNHGTGATLRIQIAGTQAGEFDVLDVTGDVELQGGLLDVVFLSADYTITQGMTFDVLFADTIAGDFDAAVTSFGLGGDERFTVLVDPLGVVTLTALTDFAVVLGDITGDLFVGVEDLDVLLANWGDEVGFSTGALSAGDVSGDGVVGNADLQIVINNWSNGTAPDTNIPEPGGLALLGLGGLALLRRRR